MEANEIKNTQELQELASALFTTLKPAKHESAFILPRSLYLIIRFYCLQSRFFHSCH